MPRVHKTFSDFFPPLSWPWQAIFKGGKGQEEVGPGKALEMDFYQNCSEIRTMTWSVIWLWKLQFTILTFFTPLFYAAGTMAVAMKPSFSGYMTIWL